MRGSVRSRSGSEADRLAALSHDVTEERTAKTVCREGLKVDRGSSSRCQFGNDGCGPGSTDHALMTMPEDQQDLRVPWCGPQNGETVRSAGPFSHPDRVSCSIERRQGAQSMAAERIAATMVRYCSRAGKLDGPAYANAHFHRYDACCCIDWHDDGCRWSCRVRALAGLRVIDASVMPTIPRANTNITTIAIADKIADDIKGSP